VDVTHWGYSDARLEPEGAMSAEEIERWTDAAVLSVADHAAEDTAAW
jgi:hypothetical protein